MNFNFNISLFICFSILPSGSYVTLYMRECSHYEMRENNRHLSCGFSETIHVIVKMPRSCCVDNCSNIAKPQPNLNFFDKIQSSMHQIFTQMYLTVSIGLVRCFPLALRDLAEGIFIMPKFDFYVKLKSYGQFLPRKCFFLNNVCLPLSTCYCGLTPLVNVSGCFPSFHNCFKKLRTVTWPSGRENWNMTFNMTLNFSSNVKFEKVF